MDELIGRTLKGTLEITERLGEGSMGTVYRAVDAATGRQLAVKIMQPARMREPGMLLRFRREATAMRRVRHPNAVEVVSHGVDQGLVYLAMELVNGTDLADHLHAEKRFAPERAARIVAEVLGALAEAHAHGVIHRDIKPENIMLGGATGDTVKLIDFGIAKPTGLVPGEDDAGDDLDDERAVLDSIPDDVDLVNPNELTTAGMLIGSPGYMAPEQWSSSAVDARTDVYACGVLLYQLVTGRLPFDDVNPVMVAQRQLYEEPAPPHEVCHEVPLALSAIILRAIRPAREDRWQSAAEMRDALRAYLIERTIAGTLGLAATLPIDMMSPLAGPTTLRLAEPARATAPFPEGSPARALPLPGADGGALGRTLVLPEGTALPAAAPAEAPVIRPALSSSVGRSGRPTPVPPASLARVSTPPPVRGALAAAQLRTILPLAAAFLTLGFLVGLLVLFPILR